jgi:hypothetical protein
VEELNADPLRQSFSEASMSFSFRRNLAFNGGENVIKVRFGFKKKKLQNY